MINKIIIFLNIFWSLYWISCWIFACKKYYNDCMLIKKEAPEQYKNEFSSLLVYLTLFIVWPYYIIMRLSND